MGLPGFSRFLRSYLGKLTYDDLTFNEVQNWAQFYGPGYIPEYRYEYNDYVLKCTECGIAGGSSMNREHNFKCSKYIPRTNSDITRDESMHVLFTSFIYLSKKRYTNITVDNEEIDDKTPSDNPRKRHMNSIVDDRYQKKGKTYIESIKIPIPIDWRSDDGLKRQRDKKMEEIDSPSRTKKALICTI